MLVCRMTNAPAITLLLPLHVVFAENSTLLLLNVRGNQLQGDAGAVQSCGNLVQLDISQNHFAGSLPVSSDWDELATYRAASNQFSGRFPKNLTSARILEHLDISNNELTGMIPPHVSEPARASDLTLKSGNHGRGCITAEHQVHGRQPE